jgi:shikimate dehydrogenase
MDEQAEGLMGLRFWKPGGALMDVAYNPWPSKLAQTWQKHEQIVISGLEMLIWQAVAQIRLFYAADMAVELPNEVAVIEAMREAAQN